MSSLLIEVEDTLDVGIEANGYLDESMTGEAQPIEKAYVLYHVMSDGTVEYQNVTFIGYEGDELVVPCRDTHDELMWDIGITVESVAERIVSDYLVERSY